MLEQSNAEKTEANNQMELGIVNLEKEETTKVNEYNSLAVKYENEVTNHFIANFPTYNQYPTYPTGCEIASLYIMLKYYYVDVTMGKLVSNIRKGSLPYYENGKVYGGNPYLEFVGNPNSSSSYGTYNDAIVELANKYKTNAISKIGVSLDEILKVVQKDRPVLVWTSYNLSTPFVSESWTYKPTGTKINWYSGEHAVVIMGYTPTKIIISDPSTGTIRYQNRSLFETRYNYFGKRAVYY